jgi:hypothetical protein
MREYWLLSNRGWMPRPYLAQNAWQAVSLAVASGLTIKGVSPRKPKVTL